MAGRTQRDLYLNVDGSVEPLKLALRVGKTSLAEFGGDVGAMLEKVQADFQRELDVSGIAASAGKLRVAYEREFAGIRESAKAALTLPANDIGALNIGAPSAAAAQQAERQALANRELATAAQAAALAQNGENVALNRYAALAQASALASEEQVKAYRDQAAAIELVQAELNRMGKSEAVAAGGSVAVVAGHGHMSTSSMILGHSIRATSDSFAAGLPPAMIFGEQISRVAEYMQFAAAESKKTEGTMAKFAGFMGGPWGIALTVGVSVLAMIASKYVTLGKTVEEEVDKLKEDQRQSERTAAAKRAFGQTVEGVTQALIEQRHALDAVVDGMRSEVERANIAAQAQQAHADAVRDATKAKLEQAIADAKLQSQSVADGGEGAGAGVRSADDRVAALQAQLKQAEANARAAITDRYKSQLNLAVEEGKTEANPLKRINDQYDDMVLKARVAAEATHRSAAALADEVEQIERRRAAALKAERASEHPKRDTRNREYGRTIDVAQASEIVRSIGGQVNSGTRSYAQQRALYDDWVAKGRPADNPVAMPGSSAHERGNALDVQFGKGITPATLKEAFEKEGVRLTKIFKERGHYHIEFGGARGRSPEAEESRQANADRSYQGELGQAQARLARANLALSDTAENRLKVELDELDAAKVQRDLEIADQVRAKKIGAPEGARLTKLNANATDLEKVAATRHARQTVLDQQLATDKRAVDDQVTLLQLQADLADTTTERRALALRILALQEQELRAEAKRLQASDKPEDQARGVALAGAVDAQHGLKVQQIAQQTQSPMEAYRDQLKHNVGDMSTAIDNVRVDALKGVEDGLLGILDGTQSVAAGFRKMAGSIIADIERIAIERALLSFLGFKDGGQVGSVVPGFADGGHISGAGTGTSDSILSWLSNGEFVVNSAATAKHLPLLHAINDNKLPGFAAGGLVDPASIVYPALPSAASLARPSVTIVQQHFTVDARGAVLANELMGQMQQIGSAAAVTGSGLARQELGEQRDAAIPL